MADALRMGIPAITIGGQTEAGDLPYWHAVGDTFDKMDPEILGRAYALTAEFIAGLGERAGGRG